MDCLSVMKLALTVRGLLKQSCQFLRTHATDTGSFRSLAISLCLRMFTSVANTKSWLMSFGASFLEVGHMPVNQ